MRVHHSIKSGMDYCVNEPSSCFAKAIFQLQKSRIWWATRNHLIFTAGFADGLAELLRSGAPRLLRVRRRSLEPSSRARSSAGRRLKAAATRADSLPEFFPLLRRHALPALAHSPAVVGAM